MSRQETERTEEVTTHGRTQVVSEPMEGPVTWQELSPLLRRERPGVYVRMWQPPTAGVLEIVGGAWNFLFGIGAIVGRTSLSSYISSLSSFTGGAIVGVGLGIFMAVLGIISIIGGSYAIRRTGWGMALAGAITASIPTPIVLPLLLGILSLIFVALGRPDFGRKIETRM